MHLYTWTVADTAIVISSEWSSIKDISEEVRMLFQFTSQTYDDVSPTEEKEASEIYLLLTMCTFTVSQKLPCGSLICKIFLLVLL